MTRNLLARIGMIAAILAAAGGAGLAGVKSYAPLSVNAAGKFASGGLAETRNTPDLVQYAECGTNATTGYCTLRDTSGTYYSCYTTDPALLTVIRSMSEESIFSIAWNASGVCTYVLSYASSRTDAKDH
ncbi:MAG: hypothetical protein R3B48_22070 [Kofleriaceae bacterium]